MERVSLLRLANNAGEGKLRQASRRCVRYSPALVTTKVKITRRSHRSPDLDQSSLLLSMVSTPRCWKDNIPAITHAHPIPAANRREIDHHRGRTNLDPRLALVADCSQHTCLSPSTFFAFLICKSMHLPYPAPELQAESDKEKGKIGRVDPHIPTCVPKHVCTRLVQSEHYIASIA